MMNIEQILEKALGYEAADIFLVAGIPVTYKCSGKQIRDGEERLMPDNLDTLIREIYAVSRRDPKNYNNEVDDDFSFSLSKLPAVGSAT